MPRNEARIYGLLRKSLVGELLDTQFDLFSARSTRAGNVTKPRALFANHEALAASSERDPPHDLDEEGEGGEIDEIVKDRLPYDDILKMRKRMSRTASDSNLATKGMQRIILNRRVLVTDTAFNIWQALLYYLYTDEIVFVPLRSQGSKIGRHGSLDGPPPCSPKSMYRLACKIKHDKLQAKALAAIHSSLTEHNIVQEWSSSLKSRLVHYIFSHFPDLLSFEERPSAAYRHPPDESLAKSTNTNFSSNDESEDDKWLHTIEHCLTGACRVSSESCIIPAIKWREESRIGRGLIWAKDAVHALTRMSTASASSHRHALPEAVVVSVEASHSQISVLGGQAACQQNDGVKVEGDVMDEDEAEEDPVAKKLRLTLLALAKRAPLDKIAPLPAALVPAHSIRKIVPTI
ncbi:hypothetical protein F4604DRAFT_1687731 [Suillus subluteus]|nr:hypothetical protein F4604DRAFT_1687731 [Suillus subluteus]